MNGFHERFDRKHEARVSSDRGFCIMLALAFGVAGYAYSVLWFLPAAFFLATAVIKPALATPLNRLWHKFGLLLAALTNPLFLAIIYYGVMVPVGWCMRLTGKDVLRLRRDANAASYWIARPAVDTPPEAMEKQF